MRACPFYFGPTGRELFGWHHPAEGPVTRSASVVLCPPLGYEYMCAYRSWRTLAERLATHGFHVLRFDYFGSGDSSGTPQDAGQLAAWLESIRLAVAALRAQSGVPHTTLVGLRMGATLAAEAAATVPGVTNLVLWDPFRTGKAYVREMRALAQLGHVNDAPVSDDLSVAGFLLTGATAADLGALDLLGLRELPATHTLIVERDDRPPDERLPGHLRSLGCAVTTSRLPGTSDCLVESMTAAVPESILDRIVEWLSEVDTPGATSPSPTRPVEEEVRPGGLGEHPFFFGPGQRLFGILTAPARPDPEAPAVVILNTGCEYHVGPHRLYVPLARRWAEQGHHVFRFDVGGIGDSRPPEKAEPNVAYPDHALDDVRSAIAEVKARTGARRVLMMGICAGGWHAFRAACDGLAVDGIIGINAPLYLREGPQYLPAKSLRQERELRRLTRSLGALEKWKKAVKGDMPFRAVAQVATKALVQRAQAVRKGFGLLRHPDSLSGDLGRLGKRGIPALFVFSKQELSLTYFELHAKTMFRRSWKRVNCEVVDEADHTFRPLEAQERLRGIVEEFLEGCRAGRIRFSSRAN